MVLLYEPRLNLRLEVRRNQNFPAPTSSLCPLPGKALPGEATGGGGEAVGQWSRGEGPRPEGRGGGGRRQNQGTLAAPQGPGGKLQPLPGP